MFCTICKMEMRKFGKNRNGSQRHRCDACKVTVTDETTRPHDNRRLPVKKLILCLRMLLEGNGVRAIERITGIHRDTIIANMIDAGENCQRFMAKKLHRLEVADIQADETWAFVGCKEKTRIKNGYGEAVGDAYCFTAIERTSKLLVAWHVGKRTPENTLEFAEKLRHATKGNFQLTTDGFRPYLKAIPFVFGPRIDFATLTKVYSSAEDDSRYSPGKVIDVIPAVQTGNPDEDRICTSHVERHNKTMRMQIRRLTRLTDGHSKKWENHEAALALFFAYYNFCRVHSTIRTTPAVAAGLTTAAWSLQDLLREAAIS